MSPHPAAVDLVVGFEVADKNAVPTLLRLERLEAYVLRAAAERGTSVVISPAVRAWAANEVWSVHLTTST